MSAYSLKLSLRTALLDYRQERPNLSLRAISKNSGVNRYFLSKLMNDEDKTTCMDLNQVLILSKFITQRKSVKDVIQASSKDVQSALCEMFNIDFIKDKDIAENYDNINLYDNENYFILVLASYGLGTKKIYIQHILGQKGVEATENLLADGCIVEKNGRIKLKTGNDFTLSTDILKHHIPAYLKHYNYHRNGKKKNFLHVYSEGLNQKSIEKIYNLHAKLNKEIQKILINEESFGDIPFFSFACMDQLLDESTL